MSFRAYAPRLSKALLCQGLCICLAACDWGSRTGPSRDAETQEMVSHLDLLTARLMANPFDYSLLLDETRGKLARASAPQEAAPLLLQLAHAYLDSGDSARCLQTVGELLRLAERTPLELGQETRLELEDLELSANLRAGEQANCIVRHNRDCCLFPIQGGGIHVEQEPFVTAEGIIERALGREPEACRLRWLNTVVATALGKDPETLDPRLVVRSSELRQQAPFPRFPEVAEEVGIRVDDIAGGAAVDDFTGDGWLDVFVSSWRHEGQLRFFVNQGDGTFVERTEEAGLLGINGGLNLVQADYDNDGRLDLYIVRGAWLGGSGRIPDSLLRNVGDGTFVDRTRSSGLLAYKPALSAAWADFNNDGHLDLFVGCEAWLGTSFPASLFLARGGDRFEECARESGVAVVGLIRGVAAGDFDNDGWTDIYVSCLGEPNVLLRNLGRASTDGKGWAFEDVAGAAGVAEPVYSFPCWFFDQDDDGWLDIFVSGYTLDYSRAGFEELARDLLGRSSKIEKPRLYRNQRNGTFRDVASETGLDRVIYAMAANYGDLDNDGWLDFYAGTGDPNLTTLVPNLMFHSVEGQRFEEVTTAGGFGHLQKGHGIAFGDLDNDGDQDIVANMGGAARGDHFPDAVFRNPGFPGHWLKLVLHGVSSSSRGVGARVAISARGPAGLRVFHRSVTSGGSFGASTLRIELGLGDRDVIDSVEVFWPVTRITQRLTGFEVDAAYRIHEDNNEPELLWRVRA